ncbi:MAG: adenylosuccinate synthase [Dehalococcoidales bacterium]|jgi:adenylosuccinate synthase|nr:adenylosuccinate synthase [Dehalococcoidales bacterium]|tara:strand:- start:435 stop:1718 length:1284 start_codon:yes stop_codon:yes gene_type:complete
MSVIAVVGAQWGDEGKGKVVDLLAERAQIVVRFSGGDNAGHTVINSYGEFKLHLVPSGIFSAEATCIIGNGVVINPAKLIEEIDQLNKCSVSTSRLVISDRAHLVMPYHILLDGLEEKRLADGALGTTRRGIGPAFADKVARFGIRAGELLDKEALRERLSFMINHKNIILSKVYGASPLSLDEIYSQCCHHGERLAPYIKETTIILAEALSHSQSILLEGAQGALLDPDFGTYPYTTSSSPLAGGGCLGAGIGPTMIDSVLGVFKVYCTRVGSGPMPTELHDETGQLIREQAHEYGTTTGRPRRCGWFDAPAARLSQRINGFTGMAITRLDVLDALPSLKICTAYKLDDKTIDNFPASVADLERCQPVYEELDGWQTPTSHIKEYDQLPLQARRYIERLEELIPCPVSLVCVGPEREQTVEVRPVW